MTRSWTVLQSCSAISLLGTLVVSCGGGGGSGGAGGGGPGAGGAGGGDAPIVFAELEARMVEASCQRSVTCGFMPDEASCKVALAHIGGALYPTLAEDVRTGKVTYDGVAASRCVEHVRNNPCDNHAWEPRSFGGLSLPSDRDCAAMVMGTVPAGGACFFRQECADHVECDSPGQTGEPACFPGTCAPAPIALGGDCSAPGARCREDRHEGCRDSAPRICIMVPDQEGADCSEIGGCWPPLRCVDGASGSMRICQSPHYPATGEPCVNGDGCDDARDTCDPSTKVCRRRSAIGAACSTDTCVRYARCDFATMMCVPPGAIGDSCDLSGCLKGFVCDATHLCVASAPLAACR